MEMHLFTHLMEGKKTILNKEGQEFYKYLHKYQMKLHFHKVQ